MKTVPPCARAAALTLPEPVYGRWYFGYSFGFALLLILGAAGLMLAGDLPTFDSLIALSLLLVLSEQRDSLFGDETSISGTIVVAMASIVIFGAEGSLTGPLLCAATCGIYWPHLRERAFAKIAVNSCSMGTAAFAGAVVYSKVVAGAGVPSLTILLLGAVAAASVFWLINSFTIAIGMVLLRGGNLIAASSMLIRSETEMLGFALAGAVCGYLVIAAAPWIGFIALVALLVVADRLVIRAKTRNLDRPRSKLVGDLVQIGLGGLAPAIAIVLAFIEPLPALGLLALLVVSGGIVVGLTERIGIERSVASSTLVGLVAVVAFPTIVGPALIGLAAGATVALRAKSSPARRCFLVGAVTFPTMAAALVRSVFPLHTGDGFFSILGLGAALSGTAVLVGAIVFVIGVAARVGRTAVIVGVGRFVSDLWLIPTGFVVAVVSASSIVGGLCAAMAAIVLMVLVDRRHAARLAANDRPPDALVSSEGDVLAAVVAAVQDSPGLPTPLSS